MCRRVNVIGQAHLKVALGILHLAWLDAKLGTLMPSSPQVVSDTRPIFPRRSTSASSVGPSKERMKAFWHLITATVVVLLHPVATQAPQTGATAASLIT